MYEGANGKTIAEEVPTYQEKVFDRLIAGDEDWVHFYHNENMPI